MKDTIRDETTYMSGHSKWSKVKHQKASTDAVKSQAFTKTSRAITIAVTQGGGIGDPEKNYHLRLALEKAREVNMPKDTIERAIERGTKGGSNGIESILYEGYGPGGVALVVEAATDNRARTVSEIKHVLERLGGTLAGRDAVNFLFTQVGEIKVPTGAVTLERMMEIAIDAGADDVAESGDFLVLYTKTTMLSHVKEKIEKAGIPIVDSGFVFKPLAPVAPDPRIAQRIQELTHELESLDDVQKVFTNVSH